MTSQADNHSSDSVTDSSSIAPVLRIIGITLCFSGGLALSATLELPSLGNTEDTDRKLVQEVNDSVVFDPAAVVPSPAVAKKPIPTAPHAQNEPTVWDLIRLSDKIPLNDSERVQHFKAKYTKDALWVNMILERGSPYIAHLVSELEARFLPAELALLPAIESGFQTDVKSHTNAAGLWQIVPLTAKEIGIKRDRWYDGRNDIVVSTTAAIDYLSYLNAEFNGDWELTLAAYNAGPGRVREAIRNNAKASKPTTFADLELPDETKDYLPKFVALVQLIKDTEQTALKLLPISTDTAFSQIDVGERISVEKAAELTDVDEKELRQMNAQLIFGVTPPDGPHVLYVPREKAKQFSTSIAKATKQGELFSEPKTHIVVAGDTLSELAKTYGVTQKRLRDLNNMDNSGIRIGQKLAVIDARKAATESIEYTVSEGDTLSGIAQKFSVGVRSISDNTGAPINGELIRPGDLLKILIDLTDAS